MRPVIHLACTGRERLATPERIGADLADYEGCERPRVVMDAVGRAYAVWEQHKLDENRIAVASFDPEGGWSARA